MSTSLAVEALAYTVLNEMSSRQKARGTGALVSVLICLAYSAQAIGGEHFVSSPMNQTVEEGSNVAFSCVVLNSSISHWYINNKTARSFLMANIYSEWGGCTKEPHFCGRTLFINDTTLEMSGCKISCQVLWGEHNVTFSKPAILIVKPRDTVHGLSPSSVSASLFPSASPSSRLSPATQLPSSPSLLPLPPVSNTFPRVTDSHKVLDGLIQRLPLAAVIAAIVFVLGSVFGAVCATTVICGCHNRRKNMVQRKISIQTQPNSNSSPVSNGNSTSDGTSDGNLSVRIPVGGGVGVGVSCSEERQSSAAIQHSEGIQCGTPPDTRQETQLSLSIEEDLNELERAIEQLK